MKRWLTLLFGLAIAAVTGFVLLSGSAPVIEQSPPSSAPHGDIDEKTEEQLLEILRAADRAER
jgi:hypothetical protein